MGAIDTTGNNAWTWTNGDGLYGGTPFWAYDEPSHTDHDKNKEHCGLIKQDKRLSIIINKIMQTTCN